MPRACGEASGCHYGGRGLLPGHGAHPNGQSEVHASTGMDTIRVIMLYGKVLCGLRQECCPLAYIRRYCMKSNEIRKKHCRCKYDCRSTVFILCMLIDDGWVHIC